MKFIKMDRGYSSMVDDEDFYRLNKYKWRVLTSGKYMKRNYAITNFKTKTIYMHRLILNSKKGQLTDHINRDGLDNRKENLRLCTISENQHNRIGWANKKHSRFKGVHHNLNNVLKPWVALLYFEGKQNHLGYYKTEEEAAKAYNINAIKYFGEFAWLNKL